MLTDGRIALSALFKSSVTMAHTKLAARITVVSSWVVKDGNTGAIAVPVMFHRKTIRVQ